jgi:hypothetical protein
MSGLRVRFWVEAVMATLSTILLIVTAMVPNWLESISQFDPDKGNGAFELAFVAVSLLLTVTLWVTSKLEWQRATTGASADPGGTS